MTRSWTKNQELAINAAKGNILVSASAGSGKTSVLSARILKRICDKENNLDITDVVAVTFTVDAAAELKKRLLLGLQEAVARDPSNKKQNRDLLNIDRAKISTVHSLCKSIIDENFSLLSLPAKMSIINESKAKELLSKTSNELTDEYHRKYFNTNTSEAKCFYRLISTLCSEKSDASIAAVLESVYGEYRSYPFWKEKLTRELELFKEDIEKLKSQNDYFFKTKLGKMMRDELLKDLAFLRFMIGKTLACTIEDSRLKQLEIEEEFYKRLTSDLIDGSFNNAKKTVLAYKRPANRSCKNDPNDRYISSIRELSQKISFNEYFESEESELISQLEENYNISRLFTEMLIKFDERYTLAKVNTLSMDYGDLECYALKLLVKEGSYNFEDGSFEKSDVALKLTNSIKEIYVDEYQDTNLLQDMIFRAISDNNLFVVGDLKQSIYAFRGAMPDIFSKYKNEYEHYADNEQPSKAKIYLSDNFRSDNSVVSISNTFFLNAMSDFDTRDDVKDELLVKSKTSESGCKSELCVVMEEKGGITKEDYIVSKIKEVLKTVTSEKGGKLSLKDIGILAETNTEIKRITKALTKGGIPWTSEVNEPFLNSSESLFMLSLLNAIDNPANDVYLVGAMVYPVFCFESDCIFVKQM